MKKVKELEETLDEQEKVLIKRHNEINLLHKENRNMKDDLDYIRSKYGTVAEIKQKMEIAEMKEKKINELISNLDTSIVSWNSYSNWVDLYQYWFLCCIFYFFQLLNRIFFLLEILWKPALML